MWKEHKAACKLERQRLAEEAERVRASQIVHVPPPPLWKRGDPWPYATVMRLPGGVQVAPLFPGRPGWVHGMEAFFSHPKAATLRSLAYPDAPQSWASQIRLDSRWHRVGDAYSQRGGEKVERTAEEHVSIWKEAGLILENDSGGPMAFSGTRDNKWLRAHCSYKMDPAFDDAKAPPLPPRECDYTKCGKVALAGCLCGEAYCSRECQVNEWQHHGSLCAQVIAANGPLGFVCTTLWWEQQGLPFNVRAVREYIGQF